MSESYDGEPYYTGKPERPSLPPRWCQYCKFFGEYKGFNVCYDVSWLRLILSGPNIVSYDDCCRHFEYHKKFLQRSR